MQNRNPLLRDSSKSSQKVERKEDVFFGVAIKSNSNLQRIEALVRKTLQECKKGDKHLVDVLKREGSSPYLRKMFEKNPDLIAKNRKIKRIFDSYQAKFVAKVLLSSFPKLMG